MLSSNLRIVPINAADTAIIIASSSASADTGPGELKAIGRTDVWRSAGTSATLTVELDSPITPIQAVALMTSNLSAAATWRIRVLSSTAVLRFDSGVVLACPPAPFGEFDWGFAPLGVNAFSTGLAAHSVCWLPERVPGASVLIDIEDPYNSAGYVEASRLVVGDVFSPDFNFARGSGLTWASIDKQERSEDGSLRTNPGARMRKLSLSMQNMTDSDRSKFAEIARHAGLTRDFLVSAFPVSADQSRVADYTMLAKFARDIATAATSFRRYQAPLEIEEV